MKINLSLQRRRVWVGYVFILPWIFGATVFFFLPLVRTFMMSFYDVSFSPVGLESAWTGWTNFQEAFAQDPAFVPVLIGMLGNTLINTPMILIFSLFIAVMLNQKLPGRGLFRAWYFLPVIIASGTVMDKLDHAGALFITNGEGELSGVLVQYAGPFLASFFNMFMKNMTWIIWDSGVQILIFLAGLQSISSSMFEAAKVDGASAWERFWKITFPMVSPLILLNMVYTLIDSLTRSFSPMMDLIHGVSFSNQIRLGYGASLSIIYFLITFLVIILATAIVNRFVFYPED